VSEVIDPTAAPSGVNRRAFVGLSAGMAVAAPAGIAAAGAQSEYGKPHPPIVGEDDPAITISRPMLVRPDTAIDSYAAMPKTITPTTPCVVVIQHIWGVDAQIRDTVRRYAKAGYIAIAPDLFARSNVPPGDGSSDIGPFRAPAGALTDDVVHGDALAARTWALLQAPKAKVGITGFCMGGGIVLKQVIGTKDYAAASMFYGDVRPGAKRDEPTTPATFAYTAKITTPLMGSFGARDTGIKADDVRAMFATLTAPHDVKVYDEAGHAFFDDTRGSYVPSAASDAWTRTQGWFKKYLT
jgi:carboxymethylenebutenolidase